jgi:hypothetical protein
MSQRPPLGKAERAIRKNRAQAIKRAAEKVDYKRLKALEAAG